MEAVSSAEYASVIEQQRWMRGADVSVYGCLSVQKDGDLVVGALKAICFVLQRKMQLL